MTKPIAAMLALMLLAGCAPVQAIPLGDGAFRVEYGERYATKANADSVLSVISHDHCPNGWNILKDYQRKGDGYPIWVWEISCLK